MDNPKVFLLKKIVNHRENGLLTLGELNAKHIDDIANIMTEFYQEATKEMIRLINNGETVDFGGGVVKLKGKKKKLSNPSSKKQKSY